jgi:hypothetical protein
MKRLFLFIILVLMLAACEGEPAELPTLVPEPTAFPTSTPTLTPTQTRTPVETLTPSPVPVIGRFATDPEKIGYLRVVHAAPDTSQVDVYVDQTSFAANLEYGLASGRTNILAGDYTVRITQRGDSTDQALLAQTDLTIDVGQSFILVFSGVPDALNITTIEESNVPLNENESRVNFVHAVPLAPQVKGQQNGIDLSPLLDFGQQSGGIVVPAGDTTLSFGTSEQVLTNYAVALFPRTHYTLILYGRSDAPDSLSVLALDNQVPGLVTMRAVNVIEGAGAVDIYLDKQPLAQNLPYAAAGERVIRADGLHSLTVYSAGADTSTSTPLLENYTFNATSAADLSVIVMGSGADVRALIFEDDLSPLRADTGRMAFVNATADVPAAQVGFNSTIAEDLGVIGYGQASPYFDILLGENRIFWQQVGGAILEDLQRYLIEGGRSYLYLLAPNDDSPVILSEAVEIRAETAALPTDIGATPIPVTRMRLVNATENAIPVNFTLNGELLAENLPYGQATEFIEIMPGTLPMIIQQTNDLNVIAQRDFRLVDSGDFTVFIYGPAYDLSAIAFSDADLQVNEDTTMLRLVNLSLDETINFGLVIAPATDPLTPAVMPPPTVPLGLPYLIARSEHRTSAGPVFTSAGVWDLIVVDNRTNVQAARFRSFNFEAGAIYDVVATYSIQTGEIRAFLLQYPKP